jgi:hypothetical protein
MKVLNLDKLAKKEGRELVIFGKTYEVEGMTVANFIETTRVAEQLAEEPSLVKQVEATIDMIARSVPSVDKADLAKLELVQLQAIVKFIRGEEVEGVEGAAAQAEGVAQEGGEAKK